MSAEIVKGYSKVVQDKTQQLAVVTQTLRPLERLVGMQKPNQTTELTKRLSGQGADTKMYFTAGNLPGYQKIRRALVDDLIDLGVPEVAAPFHRLYKYGDEKPLTEKEEAIARKLIDGESITVGVVETPGVEEWQNGETR